MLPAGIIHLKLKLPMTNREISENQTLLTIKDLKVHFPIREGLFGRPSRFIKAVDGVSFEVGYGETFGLVGESGCGKSTVGNAILRLIEPTSGQIEFCGEEMTSRNKPLLQSHRRHMQIIFQDPMSSLNPRMKVGESVGEPLYVHEHLKGKKLQKAVEKLFDIVGIQKNCFNRYPHEFSGGQRQRLVVARALSLNPKFIVCDEPVSALDVSIQSQILNLLVDLQKEMGLAYLFISHDLSVVRHISDRVAVQYLGKIVEITTNSRLFETPLHPYTIALMAAIPIADPVVQRQRQKQVLSGDLPSPENPPPGCAFHSRCPNCQAVCVSESPQLKRVGPDHLAACHFI